jgi:hypothetical protein
VAVVVVGQKLVLEAMVALGAVRHNALQLLVLETPQAQVQVKATAVGIA